MTDNCHYYLQQETYHRHCTNPLSKIQPQNTPYTLYQSPCSLLFLLFFLSFMPFASLLSLSVSILRGVAGVNWQVKIMALKFLSSEGEGTIDDAIECFEYVANMKDRGVNIVATNNSWGDYSYSQALHDAIRAHIQKGILCIAAAGNDAIDNAIFPTYLASFYLPNLIAVAATNMDGEQSKT